MGHKAIKHHLMVIASLALVQSEVELARKYTRELVELDPSVIEGSPCELVEFLLSECIADESVDHEMLLKQVLAELPTELECITSRYDSAVARGYLWKGIRACLWGRERIGQADFRRAIQLHASLDDSLMQLATYHLLGYETEYGADAVQKVLRTLRPYLNQVTKHGGDRLEGSYIVNLAFKDYAAGAYKGVPSKVIRAWKSNPGFMANRGALSIFMHSVVRSAFGRVLST